MIGQILTNCGLKNEPKAFIPFEVAALFRKKHAA